LSDILTVFSGTHFLGRSFYSKLLYGCVTILFMLWVYFHLCFSRSKSVIEMHIVCAFRLLLGAVESDSESEGISGGVRVGKNVPTLTQTSV
jgi:hypothetical protein